MKHVILKSVKAPGSRGGTYYRNAKGEIVYGVKPAAKSTTKKPTKALISPAKLSARIKAESLDLDRIDWHDRSSARLQSYIQPLRARIDALIDLRWEAYEHKRKAAKANNEDLAADYDDVETLAITAVSEHENNLIAVRKQIGRLGSENPAPKPTAAQSAGRDKMAMFERAKKKYRAQQRARKAKR